MTCDNCKNLRAERDAANERAERERHTKEAALKEVTWAHERAAAAEQRVEEAVKQRDKELKGRIEENSRAAAAEGRARRWKQQLAAAEQRADEIQGIIRGILGKDDCTFVDDGVRRVVAQRDYLADALRECHSAELARGRRNSRITRIVDAALAEDDGRAFHPEGRALPTTPPKPEHTP